VGQRPVAVAFEAHRGALLNFLRQVDFLTLYPLNPRAAASFRQAWYPSGAKSDPLDVELILEMLVRHRDRLTPLTPVDPLTAELDLLNQQRRHFVDERTALVNQLQAQLKRFFPQAIGWVGNDLSTPMAWDFLARWPTLAALQKAKPQSVRAFFYAHRVRQEAVIAERLQQIAQAKPLTQLRAVQSAINEHAARLAELVGQHPDAPLFAEVPGAGPALLPRLLAAFGTDRQRWPEPLALQTASGVAPLVIGSGKTESVQRRWACPKFCCQTFVEFAGCSLHGSDWAKAFYRHQREIGKSHWTAVRSLAYKWIRVLWHCWKNRVAYSEKTYLAALTRRGSPLIGLIEKYAHDGE
jgi:transposase